MDTNPEATAQAATSASLRDTARARTVWLPALGLVVSGLCLLITASALQSIGIIAAVVATWYLAARPLAFAVGVVGITVTGALATPLGLLAVAALWGLLAADPPVTSRWREAGWLLVASVGFAGVAGLALRSDVSLFTVGLSLALGAALTCYGLHRYEKVRLGLVTDQPHNQ